MLASIGYKLSEGKYVYTCTVRYHADMASGHRLFGYLAFNNDWVDEQLSAVTGLKYTLQALREAGTRNCTMSDVFAVREGNNPVLRAGLGLLAGQPPLMQGAVKVVTVDKAVIGEFLQFPGWDRETSLPRRDALHELDMEFLTANLQAKWPYTVESMRAGNACGGTAGE
jgi:aldehyde:ferredoxin oxidoreductase